MESLALQGAEIFCVKAEPCEDVRIKHEPTVKDEPLLDDVCVKDDLRCDGVSIKAEPSHSDVCVKDESLGVSAVAGLYADHAVKDELVLGPELVEQHGERHAPTAFNLAIEVKQSFEIVP